MACPCSALTWHTTTTGLARFERHHSTNAENAAVAFKVFVFQFINTALVTLIVFGKLPNNVQVPGQSSLNYFNVW